MQQIIACSHGTNNPDGQQSIRAIRARLQELLEEQAPGTYTVHEAYVDVQEPHLDAVVASLPNQPTVIVPLLLSAGFHTQVDMQRAAKKSGLNNISVAQALGPSTILANHLRYRLEEVGWEPGTPVVLAGAGSSRVDGRTAVAEQAQLLGTALGQKVPFGFIADIDPKITDRLGEGVYVANYLMGRGFFNTVLTGIAHAAGAQLTEPFVIPGDKKAIDVLARCALARI